MKIVILTGGTGSIALQRGLYDSLDRNFDGVDTKIIVNAYDNGLSTGIVRRVMGNRILGPSDVRKNQVTRLKLSNPDSPWIQFLDFRFTCDVKQASVFCRQMLEVLISTLQKQKYTTDECDVLFEAVECYFSAPLASRVQYTDFSLANIIYAGLAASNGNSLRAAAGTMSRVLRIPDTVLINDDKSLFLGARTLSGQRVTDEGQIVAWQNEADPFAEVFFYDEDGNDDWPVLCVEAWQAIVEADLIILSSGTQWSSLIPTYASRGFKDAVRNSKAKILMVMNRIPDKDSPSQSASDIINVLVPEYFDECRLNVLLDEHAHPRMRSLDHYALDKVAACTRADISSTGVASDKHDARKLSMAIGREFFKECLDSEYFLFDYDDTLVGRGDSLPKASSFNIKAISLLNDLSQVAICTGNTIRSVRLETQVTAADRAETSVSKPLVVFADGGVNKYCCSLYDRDGRPSVLGCLSECIFPDALFATAGSGNVNEIVQWLQRAGIPARRIDNRDDALIAIKPIEKEHRRAFICLVRYIIRDLIDLEVRESGISTVEIHKKSLSKVHALKYLKQASSTPSLTMTYVGDECFSGNDRDIREFSGVDPTVKCLQVSSLATTSFFLSTLIEYIKENDQR